MDSVLMTTPGNGMKLRSRLRSAAATICTRTSKNRRTPRNFIKFNHHSTPIGHNSTNRNCGSNINKQLNNNNTARIINNLNETRRCLATTAAHNNNGNELLFCGKRGKITREVYNAWCGRLGDVTRIPSDSVQALFNDMQLYPSKNQVLEMLQCARQCSRRNSSQFLTFGEFCVFAGELRRGNRGRPNRTDIQKTSKSLTQCEVFLGGSCNPTTWRADIAIPTLSKLDISYYNPQVSTWGPELMAAEHEAKESASVLFFVVDSQTRCVAGMLEVAHLVAKKRCLVLVVYPFTPGQSIMDEPLTSQEFVDLSEGQSTLLTLVKKQGITVHNNLSTALQCTVNLLRANDTSPDLITAERKLTDKLMKLRETFDALDTDRSGELTLPNVSVAYYQLTGANLRISDLHSIMNMSSDGHSDPDLVRITFEQFCGIVAEFTSNNGSGCHPNATAISDHEWVSPPLQRETSTNNNSNFEYKSSNYDIYLGGSCLKRTSWRQTTAIPLLKRYGVTYYNPSLHENGCNNYLNNGSGVCRDVLSDKSRHLLRDMEVMSNSKVVMFVITNETRSITSMILAAHYIALRKNVVLCVQQLPLDDCQIGSDMLTKQAIKDYNRARAYLSDLAKHENVPIFDNIKEAVQCAINLCQTQQQRITISYSGSAQNAYSANDYPDNMPTRQKFVSSLYIFVNRTHGQKTTGKIYATSAEICKHLAASRERYTSVIQHRIY